MKKLTGIAAAALMAATVGGGLAIPTAASAQVTIRFGTPGYWTPQRTNSIRNEIWQLDRAVDRADRRNTITNREARQLHRMVRNLQYNYNRYARNGLNLAEVRSLSNQVNQVRRQLRMSRLDWDREDYWRNHDRYGRTTYRDFDRDGIRDSRDRDIDNDGVANRYDRYDRNPRRY